MTKTELITEVGQRLGDTGANNLTILGNIFDQVMREIAARGGLKQLRKVHSSAWMTASTMNYNTQSVITAVASPDYILDIISIRVPAWGDQGFLDRMRDSLFEKYRHVYTDSTGTLINGQPFGWRLYPNETQLQIIPAPDATAATATAEILYLAPPTALSGGSNITELRQEHIPWLLAGCVKYGASFQDETRNDIPRYTAEFEVGLRRMVGEATRERGKSTRGIYRDV